MQNKGDRDLLDELDVEVSQIAFVVLPAHEISRRVIGQSQGVGSRLDLRNPEFDRNLLELVENLFGLIGIVE